MLQKGLVSKTIQCNVDLENKSNYIISDGKVFKDGNHFADIISRIKNNFVIRFVSPNKYINGQIATITLVLPKISSQLFSNSKPLGEEESEIMDRAFIRNLKLKPTLPNRK